ncbi:HAMP domain-containing sensor histidine kinase [Actinomadura sp. NPDC048394]|uniref:sensor histidine kinase n=1 Tax=Actinomadura sp. NPDC048394 TaxID=3158223 RepID=UPI0033CE4008
MSVRIAVPRVRPHRPRSERARATLAVAGVAGASLAVAVVAAAAVLALLADVRRAAVLAGAMTVLGAVVVAVAGWGAWAAAGRALRPVRRLDAELAEITAADPRRRLAVPDAGTEAGRLARRVNGVLDRLERSTVHRRRFIADASHELRTPLTGLRAQIELALADPADPELVDTLRRSLRDSERLHRIVDDLLALARLESGVTPDREPVDLAALVEAEVARRTAPVRVHAKAEPGLTVEANRFEVTRLLLNLLDNAERHANGLVEVEARQEGDSAIVEVRDDGPGIPHADRDRVFERFTRLDAARSRSEGGSGLGLALARQIAAVHGGTLRAADGALGARLVLRLPLAR